MDVVRFRREGWRREMHSGGGEGDIAVFVVVRVVKEESSGAWESC